MTKRLLFAFCFLLIPEAVAFADQCALLSNPVQVANALRYLKEGETIYEYCPLCGDTVATPVVPKEIRVIKTPSLHSELQDVPEYKTVAFLLRPPRSHDYQGDGTDYYEVTVNDEGIDLAYTYISFEGGYRNLATLVGCPCEDVPLVLPQEKMPQQSKGTRGRAF